MAPGGIFQIITSDGKRIPTHEVNMDLPDIEFCESETETESCSSDSSTDLSKTFWKGRGIGLAEVTLNRPVQAPEVMRAISEYDEANREVRELTEMHINRELGIQSLEELDDFRNQQYMGLAGSDGWGQSNDKAATKQYLEEAHFDKLNVIERNHRKHLISEYNARQKKIAELESLLAELKNQQTPSQFLETRPSIKKSEVQMYTGQDLEDYLNKIERTKMRGKSLKELESMDPMEQMGLVPDIGRYESYTGLERDAIMKKYIEQSAENETRVKSEKQKAEEERIAKLKADMAKLGIDYDIKPRQKYMTAADIIAQQKALKKECKSYSPESANVKDVGSHVRKIDDPLILTIDDKPRNIDQEVDQSLMMKFWAAREESDVTRKYESQPPSCNVTVVNLVGSALGFVTGLFGKLSAPATTPAPATTLAPATTPTPTPIPKLVSDEQLLREYQLNTMDPTSDEADDDMSVTNESYTRDMYKQMIRHMIRTKRDPGHLVELLDKEEARLKSPEYIEQCRKIKQEENDRMKTSQERMSISKFHNDLDKIKKDLEEKNIVAHPGLIKGIRHGNRVYRDNISTAMGSFQEKRMKVFRKDRPDQHPLTPVYDELP